MKKLLSLILAEVKTMTTFQKIQILSSIVPFYSILFTFITTYVVCCKKRKHYFLLGMTGVLYFSAFHLFWKLLSVSMILQFSICAIISLIGNWNLVRLQLN